MRRLRPFLSYLLPTLLNPASQVLVGLILVPASLLYARLTGENLSRTTTLGLVLSAAGLVSIVAALRVPGWVRGWSAFRQQKPGLGPSLTGAASVLLGILACNMLSDFLRLPDLIQADLMLLATHPLGVLSIAVLAPLGEELLFREATLGRMLRDGVRPRTALMASSLLFALVHGNPAQVPFAFLAGMLLGILYLRTRSLLLPTLLHALNNTLAVAQVWMLGSEAPTFSLTRWLGGPFPALALLLASSLGCVALLQFFWRRD